MVTDIKQYKNQKKREKKTSVFQRTIYFLLRLLVPVIIIAGLMFYLPFFDVKQIVFSGNFYLDRDTLNNYVEEVYNQNIFLINKSTLKKDFLTNSYIEDLSIKRDIPNSLVIEITERQPIAIVVNNDGFIQVSQDAVFLDISQAPKDFQLPMITGVEFYAIPGVGQKIENEVLLEALELISQANPMLMSKIAEINISNQIITAYSRNGVTILLGNSDDIQNKLLVLESILDDIVNVSVPINEIEYVDLRFKDTYIIKRFDD